MVTTSPECPSQVKLSNLVEGRLSDEESEQLEQHMLECDRCAKLTDTLVVSEDVTAAIKAPPVVSTTPEEEIAINDLIDRSRKLISDVISETEADAGIEETVNLNSSQDKSVGNVASLPATSFAGSASRTPELSFLGPAESDDELGRLGGYRILEVLGQGGMGMVLKAEDPELQRLVALKIMKPQLSAVTDSKERFLKEARAAAAIDDDNIVQIFQVGEDQGVAFIAMQFLQGESLGDRIKREGKLPQSETLRIGRETAQGLAAAHERALIHRDIKPDNIWLQAGQDRVKIVDFGLVRSSEQDSGLTQTGTVLGTPRYMAPEQASGLSVDPRCDLFSLGSVLYQLATGQSAFLRSNLTSTLMAVAHEDPPPMEKFDPDLDARLVALIMSLLCKDPAQRPQTAPEVCQRIADIEANPIVAVPTGKNVSISINTRKARPKPQPKPGQGSGVRKGTWIAIAGLAGFLFFGAILLKFRTADGNVMVQIDGNVEIRDVEIDGKSVAFTADGQKNQLSFQANSGDYELTLITSEGLHLTTTLGEKPLKIQSGKSTEIRAWLEAAETEDASQLSMNPKDLGPGMGNTVPTLPDANFGEAMATAIQGASPALVFDGRHNGVEVPFPVAKSLPCTIEGWIIPAPFGNNSSSTIFRIPEHIALTFQSSTQLMLHMRLHDYEHIMDPIDVPHRSTRTHVAVVIESNSVQIFYAGELIHRRVFDQPYQVQTNVFHLGYFETIDAGVARGFEGVIDEFRISNVARYSEAFVPAQGFEADSQTIALFHMDQDDGDQLTDSSGNGLHGKILSFGWSKNADAERYQLQAEMDAFVQKVTPLEPEAKIEAFRQKMIEANPGYDGKLKHSVNQGSVTSLECLSNHLRTIWPIRVFKQVKQLVIGGQSSQAVLGDLTPLKGLPLEDLDLRLVGTRDLGPLEGMPLERLRLYLELTDLESLPKCPLKELNLVWTRVEDLTPLKDMQLRVFRMTSGMPDVDFSALQGMPLETVDIARTGSTDLSQLKGLPIRNLELKNSDISDLSPVQGMPLNYLDLYRAANVSDLGPLEGLPLQKLGAVATNVSDLSPLQGMTELSRLSIARTRVSDLTPIRNLPLDFLDAGDCPLQDLSALQTMPIRTLFAPIRWFRPDEHRLLRSLPLTGLNGPWGSPTPVKEFWERFEVQLQAAIEFADVTAKLPVEQQSAAVLAKLHELNDSEEISLETEITSNAVSTASVRLLATNENLTPLRAFAQLKELQIVIEKFSDPSRGEINSLDLSPLDIAPLEKLTCRRGIVLRNLPILREMPTLKTINGEPATQYLDSVEADPWPSASDQ